MKVLVTGANGQLGIDLKKVLKKQGYQDVVCLGRTELNVIDLEKVRKVVQTEEPAIIIHCAAYTKVDRAEEDQDQAYLVNAIGARNISIASDRVNAKLVYISTDYVFDGTATAPIHEFEKTNPCNVYGSSKLAGETFCKQFSSKYFIVRTSWLYGEHGNNFVKSMLQLGKEKPELQVVHDQIGSPTFTIDLAERIVDLVQTEKYGTYHISNSGSCSWYEFALKIFQLSDITVNVKPCTSEEFKRPAPRPKYSVFEHMGLRINGFQAMRHWEEALEDFLRGSDP